VDRWAVIVEREVVALDRLGIVRVDLGPVKGLESPSLHPSTAPYGPAAASTTQSAPRLPL